MAVRSCAGARLLVLLLACWSEAELQSTSTNDTSDEILVQEILEPNISKTSEIQRTASTLSTKLSEQKEDKVIGIDENYQADSSENYHELLDSPQFSSGNEDNSEGNSDESAHASPENYQESHVSSDEKKHSTSNQYAKLSVLDRILQNIGRSPGNRVQ